LKGTDELVIMSDLETLEHRLRFLMIAALAGDGAAYRTLLSETARVLRTYYAKRLGSAHTGYAEDLVQETLMAIHTRRMTYDPDRPFTAWAYAIARYKLVDHFRQNRMRLLVSIDDDFELSDFSSEESVSAHRDVEQVLASLPAQQRGLINRVKIEGQSIAEAAEGTGLTPSAVKVGIHRGLKALSARFGGGRP
jgi:RNA polymerase sigma-70 factor (ECF subfamily)